MAYGRNAATISGRIDRADLRVCCWNSVGCAAIGLVWRSGGTDSRPRFLFAACILIANGSGLTKNVALELGVPLRSAAVWQIKSSRLYRGCDAAVEHCDHIWRNNAASRVRRRMGDALAIYAASSGLLIGAVLALGTWTALHQDFAGSLARIYNGLLVIVLGAIFLLPGTLDNVTDRVAVSLMMIGLSLSSASELLGAYVSLPAGMARAVRIARLQSLVLVVIGSLFLLFSLSCGGPVCETGGSLIARRCAGLAGSSSGLWAGFIDGAKDGLSGRSPNPLCGSHHRLRHAALCALEPVE